MKELTGLRRGDAVIVGSHLTGLLLGSSLAQAGLRVILLDTGGIRIPSCPLPGTVLCASAFQRIEAIHGLEAVRLYASALTSHLSDLLTSSQPYISVVPAYVFARTASEVPRLHTQQELLHRLDIQAAIAPDAGGCPFPVECSLLAQNQVLVDMAQWSSALVQSIRRQGGQVFRSSAVSSLHSTKVCTKNGCAEAPFIIFADGMPPFLQRLHCPYLLERRLLVLRELHAPYTLHSIQLSSDKNGLTLSPARNGALALWEAGRCGARTQQQRLRALDAALAARLPDWQPASTQYLYETFSADGLPVIGNLPGFRHLFAAGSGDAGILGAMHAAAVLSHRILGRISAEDQLYAPGRQLPRRFLEKERQRNRKIRLRSLVHRNAPACSYCRCRMRYCPPLAHWECPACGSVFDMLGQVICGPAMEPAAVSVRQRPV